MTVSVQGKAVGHESDDDRTRFGLAPYFNLGIYVSRNLRENLAVFGAAKNVLNSRFRSLRHHLRRWLHPYPYA
jgi:hypothetical protein